ncbi:Hypothetical Protein RradSPS_0529 [Rubrobacter radiotolerans]|uniref:Uncharacterized protein n=1 Tax=Rubrobacter radiotolerans TaxID=42256 RepID=A0A023X006_RUBRA|nr:hypothetical protein [Rubrobacter radiotolerans]AHY45812.1 Hypothetical Protein RradSPS_0529 [Rubrobacter radiotolerans]MDX5893226.1 hypothetical protein [Rubrobacter radiotolerans]SMC03314.1 conserved hypothetical protein [Rubrobacter radiotolerans DSM 5868]
MAYLEGVLRENAGSEVSDHTGYVLEIEVDLSSVDDLEDMVGGQVAITGDVRMLDLPERGKVLVFKATSAAALEDEEG